MRRVLAFPGLLASLRSGYISCSTIWSVHCMLCYVFTKLVERWNSKCLRGMVYIDNSIFAARSQDQCVEGTEMILGDLALAGLFLISLNLSSHFNKLASGSVSSLTF